MGLGEIELSASKHHRLSSNATINGLLANCVSDWQTLALFLPTHN